MSLSVINWNILYATQRPSDSGRFSSDGRATETEKKAGTAALAFFCYKDNTSPSDPNDAVIPAQRQKVKQRISQREYSYFRGGSNAGIRMGNVRRNIQSLAGRVAVVCLQEVTKEMKEELEKTFKATHHVFYSYQAGNNHGVMVLVKNQFKVIKSGEVNLQGGAGLSRLVRYVDIACNRAVVRVAAAHLYGHKGPGVSPHQETEGLFTQLTQIGPCDTIVLAADVNVPKKFRQPPSSKIHYAEATDAAGWQLQLTKASAPGILHAGPKPAAFGLCAIMQDKPNPSQPIDLSDLPPALSDHAPIGTTITLPKLVAAARPFQTSLGGFFGFLSRISAAVSGFFKRLFSEGVAKLALQAKSDEFWRRIDFLQIDISYWL